MGRTAMLLTWCSVAHAASFWVAPNGKDTTAGTKEAPFRTIQKAADVMRAGDVCVVRGGTYRETVRPGHSGQEGKPIRFVAAEGETVVLDGTEPIRGEWALHKGSIYKTKASEPFVQLFVDRKMMLEARWPNMRFDQILDRAAWARAGKGSRYGKMVDPKLAGTGVNWTGAIATLNLAHQFYTWTRTVEKHAEGTDTFTYPRNLRGITSYADKTRPWEDDRYYLSGKLEALDAPTEWFRDPASGVLYLYADDGKSPVGRKVEYKKRDYAFDVTGHDWLEVRGFRFFATSFQFVGCNHCVVDDCRLVFPTYARRVTEFDVPPSPSPATGMQGDHNTVRRTSLAYANAHGLTMVGRLNTVENCIVHDVCWNGSLANVPIRMLAAKRPGPQGGGTVRRCTVYNLGNAGICFYGQPYVIEQNHVFDGGLACKDVSLIYTGSPSCAGSIVRYNWAHGCQTPTGGGMGIRGDDQTRSLTVHHNVVWDCGIHGIIVKGDHNRVLNNTVFGVGARDAAARKRRPGRCLLIPTRTEPTKPWRKQFPLLKVQNPNSLFCNNAVGNIVWRGKPFPAGDNISNNLTLLPKRPAGFFVDPGNMDFRPKQGSPLIDAGRVIPGFTDGYKGKAPDIGAYESGAGPWKPGADWTDD